MNLHLRQLVPVSEELKLLQLTSLRFDKLEKDITRTRIPLFYALVYISLEKSHKYCLYPSVRANFFHLIS